MTVNAITDTKKGRTGIAPTYLHTTPNVYWKKFYRPIRLCGLFTVRRIEYRIFLHAPSSSRTASSPGRDV